MSDINWIDEAVCYAHGKQWFIGCDHYIENINGIAGDIDYALRAEDFQLNEIREGDYIPASELDTEQKYNDVVEVFGLSGFKAPRNKNYFDVKGCQVLKVFSGYVAPNSLLTAGCKRQLAYHQIIAIGKLKRMMLERQDSEPALMDDNSVQAKLSNIGNVLHNISCSENDEDVQGELEDYAFYLWDLSKSMVNEKSAPKTTTDLTADFAKSSSNKYEREITDRQGNSAMVDVYDVLKAFEVTCPATQHAVKKLLCSGLRGHKDMQTDLIEAKESIVRAIELN